MGSEKSERLEELKTLDQAVDQATDLNELRPIFYRLDEIARQNSDDVEAQLAIGDIKQHILNRGNLLKERKQAGPFPPPVQDDTPTDPVFRTPPVRAGTQPSATYAAPPETRPGPTAGPPGPPPEQPGQRVNRKGARRMGVAIATIAVLAAIAVVVVLLLKRSATPANASLVAVQIATVPPGASVRVNGQAKCTSDCSVSLPPGAYQVDAALDGYEPGAGRVTLLAGQPAALNLILQPQPQTVRIHTDLARGSVIFDNQTPVVLRNGDYTFERVPPGRHTVKVMGSGGETSFSFDLGLAKRPAVMGTVVARDVLVVLVAAFANQARVVTSSGPWKLAVNGHGESDAGPAGVDLENLAPGEHELVIGEGKDRRSVKVRFGPAPALTAFVTTDPNAGTLIVSTGENGVRVLLNDKEYPLRTRRGELRIQTTGPVAVRVSKNGFQDPPAQVAEIKKGSQVRLEFKMVALPASTPPP